METTQKINKQVDVTAWYFQNRQQNFTSYPKRMEFARHEYTFADGLRFLIWKGKQAVQLFDMTDGINHYRLRFDSQNQIWTLVSISQTQRAI